MNVQLENSYLLDSSDTVVNWINESGYNIIDVNVLKHIPTAFDPLSERPRMIAKSGDDKQATLLKYLWDNYVESVLPLSPSVPSI